MTTKTLLLLVEGPHDLEFCARLLKCFAFSRIQRHEVLQKEYPFWTRLVPERWPQKGDLLARHPVPVFFANPEGRSVAMVNAVGLSKLAMRLGIDLAGLNQLPDAVAVLLDADDDGDPCQRHARLLGEIAGRPEPELRQLRFPPEPGQVATGIPRCGVFVLPDNRSTGTLEDLLLEAGAASYPGLHAAAEGYVRSVQALPELGPKDVEELRKPAGLKKATVAAMSSILKPGKAIQVSIQDNRWLEENSIALPRIAEVIRFFRLLLE
jgi:hypothetical protein